MSKYLLARHRTPSCPQCISWVICRFFLTCKKLESFLSEVTCPGCSLSFTLVVLGTKRTARAFEWTDTCLFSMTLVLIYPPSVKSQLRIWLEVVVLVCECSLEPCAVLIPQPVLKLIWTNSSSLWYTGVSMRHHPFGVSCQNTLWRRRQYPRCNLFWQTADPCWVKQLPRNLVWMPTLPSSLSLTTSELSPSQGSNC